MSGPLAESLGAAPQRALRWGSWALLLSVLGTTGCDLKNNGPSQSGELGKGTFTYKCLSAADLTCQGDSTQKDFPAKIAVGAVFDVAYSEHLSWDNYRIESASPVYLVAMTSGFRAVKSGQVAVLARDTGTSRMTDFLHIRLVAIDHLRLLKAEGQSAQTLLRVGDEQTLFANAQDLDGDTLAGQLSPSWTSSNPEVIALGTASPSVSMNLIAKAPGKSTIEATVGQLSAQLEITVEQGAE